MKNILGISLVVVGGGGIAYILSLKDKKIGFVDNESTKCDRLSYEKEKTFGDLQEFNLKNTSPTTEQQRKIASGDKKEISYWQGIDKQRNQLMSAYNLSNSEWEKSSCVGSQKTEDVVDCNRLKENIDTYKEQIAVLEKNPEKNRENSATAGDIRYYKELLEPSQKTYDKNNCVLNIKSDVSVSESAFQFCIGLDKGNREIKNEILKLRKKALTTSGLSKNEEVLLSKWEVSLNENENQFTNRNCRDKIETKRLTATAVVSTKLAEEMERQVLSRNQKEKYVYIGVGGLVLLTGLFIILKK
jgi:hypothetical protein